MQLTKPTFSLFAEDFELMKVKLSSNEIVDMLSALSDMCLWGECSYTPQTPKQEYFWEKMKTKFEYDLSSYRASVENGKKGAKYGVLGGRPKKTITPKETPVKTPTITPEETPSCHLSPVNNTLESCEKKHSSDKSSECKKEKTEVFSPHKKFQKPTLEEITAYCKEKNMAVNPQTFYEYFEAGNWVDSKGQKVRNWKQKLITWNNRQSPDKIIKPPISKAEAVYQQGVEASKAFIQRELEKQKQRETTENVLC